MTPRHFAWQAWHLARSTFVLRGKRGALSHPPSFCVAGVALGDRHLRSAWQASPGAASLSHKFVRHSWSSSSSRRPPVTHNTTLSHTIFHTQLSHNFVNHHLSHTKFTHNFHTHNFVTHHLSHTLFHIPFCHTPSFNFVRHSSSSSSSRRPPVTHNTTLSHTIFHTQLSHTTLSTTIFHTHPLSHTPSFTHNFHTQLCHTPSFTHPLSHTILSHTIFRTPSVTSL